MKNGVLAAGDYVRHRTGCGYILSITGFDDYEYACIGSRPGIYEDVKNIDVEDIIEKVPPPSGERIHGMSQIQ